MNRFNKIFHHINSDRIDERIGFLNKQLKKTGVVVEDAPTNSTSGLYQLHVFTPAVPEETGDVPDTTGFASGGTQPTNGGDSGSSGTWDDGWKSITDMKNSNDLNGETNRPIPVTPDLSGWDGSGSRSTSNPIGSTYAGIYVFTISGGGQSIGTLTGDNIGVRLLVPDNIFGTYNYPSGSNISNYYSGYSTSELQAAKNLADTYEANKGTAVSRDVWVPFNSSNGSGGASYADYTGVKKTESGSQYLLKNISVLSKSNSYTSQDPVASFTTITRNSIDDPNYYAGNPDKFRDFLMKSLDVGETAFEYLQDKSTDIPEAARELFAMPDVGEQEKEIGLDILKKSPEQIQSSIRGLSNVLNGSSPIDALKNWKGLDGKGLTMAEKAEWAAKVASQIGTAGKIYGWYLTGNLGDGDINNSTLGDDYVNNIFEKGLLTSSDGDGVFVGGDNVIGTGGKPFYDPNTGEIVIPFEYDFDTNEEAIMKDPDNYDPSKLGVLGMVGAWISGGKYGLDSVPVPPAGYATWLAKLLGGAKGSTGHEIRMDLEDLKELNKPLYDQLVEAGILTPYGPDGGIDLNNLPSWFWYGGFYKPTISTYKGMKGVWGTNYSGASGFLVRGGSDGYGTRGWDPKTRSGGINYRFITQAELDKMPDPDKKTPPKKDDEIAGKGGSPGQPYDPPVEDPNDPYVPAPGKGGGPIASGGGTSPFPRDPASDATPGLGADDGDKLAWGGGNKGDQNKWDKKLSRYPHMNIINYHNTSDPEYKPKGWTDDEIKKYIDKHYYKKSSIGAGGDTKIASGSGVPGRSATIKRDDKYSLGPHITPSRGTSKKKKWNNKLGLSGDPAPRYTGSMRAASYKPQGKLISEGWASPNHYDIDKDEKKRWFSQKDIKPEYPKELPPKMVNGRHPKLITKLDTAIPIIKVSKKELERNHLFKKDEIDKMVNLADRLNVFIKRNPDQLAFARERYPKGDARLATLNYKLDMQLAATEQYVEKQFPENERLFNMLMDRTRESIKLTDPATFKSEKGAVTTFSKLARLSHFDNEYQPKEIKIVRKKRSESAGRFFRKSKEKTKDDILKDKLAVLDKEMLKTMPDL